MSSPAEIVRGVLVEAGLVVAPGPVGQMVPFQQTPGDGSTICYVGSMPDDADQGVCVFDVAGVVFGRSQRGKTLQHFGIKVLVRALDYETGHALLKAIATTFEEFRSSTVPVGVEPNVTLHYVQSIYQTSTLLSLGEEPSRHRQLFSLNLRVAMQDQEP